MDLLNLELTKWPQLVVTGKNVTTEQAAEIIIRTTNLWFTSNEEDIEEKLYEIIDKTFKFTYEIDKNTKNSGEKKALRRDLLSNYNSLDLHYLENERIVNCWVDGTKGWLSWSGEVGCSNYNIGKWPTTTEVYKEWKLIAKAFPYLDLQCQLMSGESCEKEEEIKPVIEYIIKNGDVQIKTPTKKLKCSVDYTNPTKLLTKEFGCTFEQFRNALQYLKIERKK